jgi:hypothetical protein
VDYPAAQLVLARGTLPAPDGVEILRAVRVGPFVGVELDVGGVKEVGVVDTQGGIGFQALPEVADRLAFEKPLEVHFAVTLDQRSMRVRFTRPDTAAITE